MNQLSELPPAKPELNEGQKKAYSEIIPYLTGKDKEHLLWVLKGYAGTGKTFTLSSIVEELMNLSQADFGDYRIAMSAPTHKAVRVMKKFSTFKPGSVHYATIHSLLGLKAEINERTGKEEFKESKDPTEIRIEQFNILILDETSMLADDLFILLLKHVRKGLKILFVGDPVQIPPVNHLDALPFKPEAIDKYKMGVSELTQIMRQAGENPILRLATAVRMGYKTVPHFLIETSLHVEQDTMSGVERIEKSDDDAVLSTIKTFFVSEEFKADPDHMKIIAWRNKTVDAYNRLVRERIYPLDELNAVLPFIMPGEKLIVDKPVIIPETNKVLLTTNEEIEVLEYDVRNTNIQYLTAERRGGTWVQIQSSIPLKYYMTRVSYFDVFNKKVQTQIRILHEDDHKQFDTILEEIATAAKEIAFGNPLKNQLWKSFFGLKKLFAQVKYNYAITAHKS